jgi:hypothetical protein
MRHLATAAVAVLVLVGPARAGEKVELNRLPKPVKEAAAKRFPKAEAKSASRDGTGDKATYEVTLKENGKNIDVSLTAAGAITQIEQEFAFKDLPKAVAETFEKKYPKATYKMIEAVITVKDGKETLEYYEAVLTTADKKTFEAEVLPDGKFKGETEKAEKPPGECGDDKNGEDKKSKKNADEDARNEKGNKKKENDEKGDMGAELPKAVAGAVKEKFPGGKVVGASKEGKGEKATYEVELRYKAATLEVVLTAKGEVVEVEVKGKKNDDEDDDKGGKKKGKKDEDDNEKGTKKGEGKQSGFEGEQKGQHEDKDDKKGEAKKKGKKKGEDDKDEKGKNKKGEKDRD